MFALGWGEQLQLHYFSTKIETMFSFSTDINYALTADANDKIARFKKEFQFPPKERKRGYLISVATLWGFNPAILPLLLKPSWKAGATML